MSKRGNYFIAMYDVEDNYIRDFENIHDCAIYFNTKDNYISECICRLNKIKSNFLLYKINDYQSDNLSKSLQERTR